MNKKQNEVIQFLLKFKTATENQLIKLTNCNMQDINYLLTNKLIIKDKETGLIYHKLRGLDIKFMVALDLICKYQKDLQGYKIADTKERRKEASQGKDIYLTIDSQIQFFVEQALNNSDIDYDWEWFNITIMDAKTGALLATATSPSFDPNIRNITNYLDPTVSSPYEPGSTMKTFTYMAAMEKKVYDGNDTFESGSIKIGENEIFDWKPDGFGTITYDEGFILSSNVGISYLTKNYFTAEELKKYFEKFGFGSKTGIELPGELSGTLNFKYPVEIANAGFGQGITITPIQMIQALTTIANDGVMLKPYIVDKILDYDNEIVYQGQKEEIGQVVSKNTTNQIKDLLYDVIYNDLYYSTGALYKMEGYDLIGKTGTAQYVDESTGKYYFDTLHYIRSFAGMFPKDDPEVIIYVALKRPYDSSQGLKTIVRGLVKDISNYRGIYNPSLNNEASSYVIGNYLNKDVDKVKSELEKNFENIVIIGDGEKVIDQYPKENNILKTTEKIYLLTNGENLIIPDFNNWSKKRLTKTAASLSLSGVMPR